MQLKDYYSVLELSPSASLDEVKKAYRRLAHQFHPDKNGNDPYAAAQFEIIKEAYEVLSNPSKKEYYLQQRWYAQSTGRRTTQQIVTPVSTLKQMLELDKYVSKLDVHRMDQEGLYNYICDILLDENIQTINSFHERDMNKSIVDAALRSSRHLSSSLTRSLSLKLLKLNTDELTIQAIHKHVQHSRRSDNWNKYKPWIILLLVLFICLLIYGISH